MDSAFFVWSYTMKIENFPNALLPRHVVELMVGLGRSAIYARLKPGSSGYDPSFPKPVAIGGPAEKPTSVRWVASEVMAWCAKQVAARDAAAI